MLLLICVLLLVPARAATLRYWIDPCTNAGSGCRAGDPELARWALEAWQAASAGRLTLEPAQNRGKAHIRVVWATQEQGLYGEARPIVVDGMEGAEVYVRPAIVPPEVTDTLLRDAIVYLTCLHETGHALGLPHTAAFDDIMYSFQFGGDIGEYFGRYRRKLSSRRDIRKHSGMSPRDRERLAKIRK
jgi:hypothetical protein